jgi:hypothetical protein
MFLVALRTTKDATSRGGIGWEDVRWMRERKRGRGSECTSRVMEGKGHSSTVGVVLSLALGPFGASLVALVRGRRQGFRSCVTRRRNE